VAAVPDAIRILDNTFNPILKSASIVQLSSPFTHDVSSYHNSRMRTSATLIRKVSPPSAKKSVPPKHSLYCSTCSLPFSTRNLKTGQGHSSKKGCPIPLEVIADLRKVNREELLEALQAWQPGIKV